MSIRKIDLIRINWRQHIRSFLVTAPNRWRARYRTIPFPPQRHCESSAFDDLIRFSEINKKY